MRVMIRHPTLDDTHTETVVRHIVRADDQIPSLSKHNILTTTRAFTTLIHSDSG